MSKLDRIGAVTSKSTKKSTKLAATVTDEIKASVDEVIQLKGRIKADTAALGEKEFGIIEHVRAQQDSHALAGEFSKSFEVSGTGDAKLLYTTSDRFSVPQGAEEVAAIRQLIGTQKFSEFFKEQTALSIKSAVLSNEPLLDQILTACETAGLNLNDIFEKVVRVEAVEGLDEKQYSMGAAKLVNFRTLVRQNKPALK